MQSIIWVPSTNFCSFAFWLICWGSWIKSTQSIKGDLNRILSNNQASDCPYHVVKSCSNSLNASKHGKRLEIRASILLWMIDDILCTDLQYGYRWVPTVGCCRPSDLSGLPIRLSGHLILDHMTPRYQKWMAVILIMLRECEFSWDQMSCTFTGSITHPL